MGRFKPGESGNPAGKKPGTKSKSAEQIRKVIAQVLNEYIDKDSIIKDLQQLDPKDRLAALDRLFKHILPAPLHPLETLTNEQLKQVIDQLRRGEI